MMSLMAKAVLVELRTTWPSGLRINADNLRVVYPEIGGRDKARKVVSELVSNGHLNKVVSKFNNGQFTTTFEIPEPTIQAPVIAPPQQQVDNILLTIEESPCSDGGLNISASRQYVASSYSYLSIKPGTSYLSPGGREGIEMNKWKEEEPTMVFGSVPDDEPKRPVTTKAEKASVANRSVKDKSQWSTADVVFYFRDLLALKRPMDYFFAIDKARASMATFRLNHQTTALEETQLVKDYFTFSQHYDPSMSALHVWWKFLTYAAANIGRIRFAGTAAPAMTDQEAEAILAATMERLMS